MPGGLDLYAILILSESTTHATADSHFAVEVPNLSKLDSCTFRNSPIRVLGLLRLSYGLADV
jgi:hypothetical protein